MFIDWIWRNKVKKSHKTLIPLLKIGSIPGLNFGIINLLYYTKYSVKVFSLKTICFCCRIQKRAVHRSFYKRPSGFTKKNLIIMLYDRLIYTLLLFRVKRTNARHSSQDLFQKVFNSKPETKLLSLGIKTKEKDFILEDLEEIFNVKISGINREEIITVQDLLTAVYLQLTQNIVP